MHQSFNLAEGHGTNQPRKHHHKGDVTCSHDCVLRSGRESMSNPQEHSKMVGNSFYRLNYYSIQAYIIVAESS